MGGGLILYSPWGVGELGGRYGACWACALWQAGPKLRGRAGRSHEAGGGPGDRPALMGGIWVFVAGAGAVLPGLRFGEPLGSARTCSDAVAPAGPWGSRLGRMWRGSAPAPVGAILCRPSARPPFGGWSLRVGQRRQNWLPGWGWPLWGGRCLGWNGAGRRRGGPGRTWPLRGPDSPYWSAKVPGRAGGWWRRRPSGRFPGAGAEKVQTPPRSGHCWSKGRRHDVVLIAGAGAGAGMYPGRVWGAGLRVVRCSRPRCTAGAWCARHRG